ncbi:hypothetical protein LY76DRAFT_309863 [Colletotrichum caudatum]|nr:hypothetical protein LY76DRAFT_309863 [Colletotrichum caudatum]
MKQQIFLPEIEFHAPRRNLMSSIIIIFPLFVFHFLFRPIEDPFRLRCRLSGLYPVHMSIS